MNSRDSTRFRDDGHALVDVLAAHLDAPPSPVMPAQSPAEASALFSSDFSESGEGSVVDVIKRVLPLATQLHHPGFIGHQVATPLVDAALCDFADSFLNNGMAVFEMGKAGVAMERAVLEWLARALALPSSTSGVLVNGGSIGNLTALLAARQAKSEDAWSRGVRGQPLCVFVADTAHYSVARAVRILGLGDEGCVSVPVDDQLRMDVGALQLAIEKAKKQKKKPIAVVASAASTAAGAFDPLDAIADVCAQHGLWMHVDGAHGGPLALLPECAELVRGLSRADSVVVDFHKMLMMPALVTAVLFRDPKSGAAAFAQQAGYLFDDDSDQGWSDVGRRTIECTKKMLALKVYACLRAYGVSFFRDHVRRCLQQARTLADLVKRPNNQAQLELLVEPSCNIVCFRPRDLDGGRIAQLRKDVVADGGFYCVQVHLHARGLAKEREGLWLRATLLNPRTSDDDLARFVDDVAARIKGLR